MNGARTTHMRRGWLLTALAAAVLLAASSGTAQAQLTNLEVTLSGPQRVNEGGDVTIQVRGEATIAGFTATAQRVTIAMTRAATTDPVTRSATAPGVTAEISVAGQVDDLTIVSNPTVTLEFAANSGSVARTRNASATLTVRTNHDTDAENELARISAAQPQWFDGSSDVAQSGAYPPQTPGGGREDTGVIGFQIADDEQQDYELTLDRLHSAPGSEPKEGGVTVTVNIEADPPHYDDSTTFALGLYDSDGRSVLAPANPQGYTLSNAGNMIEVGEDDTDRTNDAANEGQITFDTPESDGNRATDTITLEADAGSGRRFQQAVVSLPINILDIDLLPVATAVARDMDGNEVAEIMEGGDPVYLTITVDRREAARNRFTDEDLTVDIEAAYPRQASDYMLSVTEVDFDQPNSSQDSDVDLEIMLSASADEDVGPEDLVLNLVTSGDRKVGTETSTGTFTIAIVDDTEKKIAPKHSEADYDNIKAAIAAGAGEEGLNPGETVELMTSDLFEVAEGYTASYGVSVDSDAVTASASGDTITINAAKAGMAVVYVTGTARMAGSSLEANQTVSTVAELKFPVEVVDKALMVTLEMPDNVMDGNIVEGSSYDIGVMANRMITEAEGSVEVMIMRDRSASDADDSDFTVSSATIMAGYDSATATLEVIGDMEPDGGTNDNMGEELVLYGMAGDSETNSLTFTIWDQAVPSLPLIGQLLLALFLMAGGARLYRRRQG